MAISPVAARAEETALHAIAASFEGAADRANAVVARDVVLLLMDDVPTLHAVGICFLNYKCASRYPTSPADLLY